MVGIWRKEKKMSQKGRLWKVLWKWSLDPKGCMWAERKVEFLLVRDVHACEHLIGSLANSCGSWVGWAAAKDKYNVGMKSKEGESHAVSRISHSGSQLGMHTREITHCHVSGHREYLVTLRSSQPNARLQVSSAVLNTASSGQPPALGCWLMPPRTGMTQQARGSCFQKASRALLAHCTGFWHILFWCFSDACQLCTNSSGMQ